MRLKGGDPFVFARGGEEAAALLDAGVDFEVVPGISSAIAVPAYAGIPLTLRHSSTSFTVITGTRGPGQADGEVDWEAVARLGGTLVILMGVARMEQIAARLVAGGLDPDTPAAAVRWGTRPEQRTVRATLATLADHDLEPPSTIVVGKVAAMDLAWFETRPLFGRQVVVTRPGRRPRPMRDRLRAVGAEPVEVPVIEIVDPADEGAALAAALGAVATYDWVVVTSANGASRLLAGLHDARDLGGVRVAAIGPGTAAALAGRQHPGRSGAGPLRRRGSARRLPGSDPAGSRPGARSCGRRWPATCCPTVSAAPAGRSTWSRPTGRCRPSRPTANATLVGAADAVTLHLVVHGRALRRRLRDRRRPAAGRLDRTGHLGDGPVASG